MLDDKFYEELSNLVNGAFDQAFGRKAQTKPKKNNITMEETQMQPQEEAVEQPQVTDYYESIEDYKAKTGKRFRMLKDQKERGLSREEAFEETYGV